MLKIETSKIILKSILKKYFGIGCTKIRN